MAQENYGKRILEVVERMAAKVGVGDMRDGQEDLESLNKRLGRMESKLHRMLEMMEGADEKEGLG